ncbi:2Fe-2S iron-sulfur cluster-binding protein [Aquimarina sp. 2201CG1-2-11]|uniref:2Fe-2S iron-sulfur cluster-binding protein n=1 Tax=Aquimarina discodermiae TaxID=3231043 RepID=UPI0034632600
MKLTIIDFDNEIHLINYSRLEYPNLMELIVNTFYTEIGECKGRGLCGTCIVEIITGEIICNKSDQENHTLKIACKNTPRYRLACQIVLNKTLDNSVFKLVNEQY